MDKLREAEAKYADNPLFQQVVKEGLAIQDRFSAEPVYAKTGKGYLKSVGVSEIREAKHQLQKSKQCDKRKGGSSLLTGDLLRARTF